MDDERLNNLNNIFGKDYFDEQTSDSEIYEAVSADSIKKYPN